MCELDHVALSVKEYDWYISFFETVFGMKVKRETGKEPDRKLWFDKGIQLIECQKEETSGTLYNHIAFRVNDKADIYTKLEKLGCEKYMQKENWFLVKEKLVVEIL